MLKNGATISLDGMGKFLKDIQELTKRQVLVGVPAAETERNPDNGTAPKITNAALAYIHENGSPAQNIPARPFLSEGIKEGRTQITNQLKRAGEAILDGGDPEPALNAAGLTAQVAVQKKIRNGPFAPLADSTLAARRARGRKGTRPLNDTGQLRNSITYVIRSRGA